MSAEIDDLFRERDKPALGWAPPPELLDAVYEVCRRNARLPRSKRVTASQLRAWLAQRGCEVSERTLQKYLAAVVL